MFVGGPTKVDHCGASHKPKGFGELFEVSTPIISLEHLFHLDPDTFL